MRATLKGMRVGAIVRHRKEPIDEAAAPLINEEPKKPFTKRVTSAADLNTRFRAKLFESGLTVTDAAKLGFRLMLGPEAASLLKLGAFAGFQIPYFNELGKPTKFWRYRFLEDTRTGFAALTNAKSIRYIQPVNTINEVYIPPLRDWRDTFRDISKEIIITEGELKAACATKLGIPTIALGGVWTFMSKKSKLWMLPFFTDEPDRWKGRTVVIVFDSDAATNPNVLMAEFALAKALTVLGALVYILRLPNVAGRTKTGLDDYLMSEGAASFVALRAEHAQAYVPSAALHELNTEVVYVRDPGLIIKLENLQRMSVQNFTSHAYAPRIHRIEIPTKDGTRFETKSAAVEWIKWGNRFELERIAYLPEEPFVSNNQLNVWPGYGADGMLSPVKGDIRPWLQYLDWIFPDKEDADDRRWFEQWCACPFQKPGVKQRNAVVFWSSMNGSGKSIFGELIMPIIYGKNATMISESDLTASHNDWAENKQFVLGDEIGGQADTKRSIAEIIKTTISRPKIRINPKFIPAYELRDCINYFFTSNKSDAFLLDRTDRRFFIHRAPEMPLPFELRDAIVKWTATPEGAAALLYYFKTIDMTGYDPYAPPPVTIAKREMIAMGQSDLSAWITSLKEDPDSVLRLGPVPIKYRLFSSEALLNLFIQNKNDGQRGRYSVNVMGRELANAGFARAAKGWGCRTREGQLKLWVVRDVVAVLKLGQAAIGDLYDKEREADKVLKKRNKLTGG